MPVSIVGCNGGTGSGREEIGLGEHACDSVGGHGERSDGPSAGTQRALHNPSKMSSTIYLKKKNRETCSLMREGMVVVRKKEKWAGCGIVGRSKLSMNSSGSHSYQNSHVSITATLSVSD